MSPAQSQAASVPGVPTCQAHPRHSRTSNETCANPAKGAYIIGPLPGRSVALLCGNHAQHSVSIDVIFTQVDLATLPSALRESYRKAQMQYADNLRRKVAELEATRDRALAAAGAATYHATVGYILRAVCQVRPLRDLCAGAAALLSEETDQVALLAGGGRLHLAHGDVELTVAAESDSAANGHPFRATVTHAGRLDLTVAALRLITRRLRDEEGDTYVLVEALDVGNQLVVRTLDDDPRHLIDLALTAPAAIMGKG
jgi:hypothetical protein